MSGVFLSWAPYSRRSQTLASRFGLDHWLVTGPGFKRPAYAPLKYPVQAAHTASLLARRRPATIWVQDPPLPAVALAAGYARLARVPLVVDVHTVDFYSPKWRALRPLEKPLLRRARAVVVTNEGLARRVRDWGCLPFVLPDPLPQPPPGDEGSREGLVTVVATYSDDEPLHLLPEVAKRLTGLSLDVTGEPRRDLGGPANLRATGFLADDEYWRQLRASEVVVVLTTRPDTLLSGGYEALVLARPLVVSDHDVLREYFGDAAVYAHSDADALEAAIRVALARSAELQERARLLAAAREAEWERAAGHLRGLVGGVR